MNKKNLCLIVIIILSNAMFSQPIEIVQDSILSNEEKKFSFSVDLSNRYIWRGQSWGGDYAVVQPTINYQVTPKLSFGIWATSNFKKDYYYPDGISAYKGYQEIDFFVNYQLNKFLQIQLWEYYWPSVRKVEGVNNNYFNYNSNGTKTVDFILYFDFLEQFKLPLNATISTLIAGNDYSFDSFGENKKQNYTTYLELGYTLFPFFKNKCNAINTIAIMPTIGAVLNNKAEYYSHADFDRVSIVNLSVKLVKEISLTKSVSMPLSFTYIHNGATQNTDLFGKNFLITTWSFAF